MTAKLVRPALYHLEGIRWTWAKLDELAQVVEMTPKACWDEFFFLSKDFPHCLAISSGKEIENISQDMLPKDTEGIFVPAGWVTDILDEIDQRLHGCKHKDSAPVEYEVLCAEGYCPQDEDPTAPNGGHTCGHFATVYCTRCGEPVDDTRDPVIKAYRVWKARGAMQRIKASGNWDDAKKIEAHFNEGLDS